MGLYFQLQHTIKNKVLNFRKKSTKKKKNQKLQSPLDHTGGQAAAIGSLPQGFPGMPTCAQHPLLLLLLEVLWGN